MTFFRRRLRLLAAVWFLFQGASLSAIVPGDCCATHTRASHRSESVQQESSPSPSCHETVTVTPDEGQCPMRGANGAPCAMHTKGQGGHAAHHPGSSTSATHADAAPNADGDTSARPCTMRALCTGPMDALVVLLVQPGVLPNHAVFAVDLPVDEAPPTSPARLIHGLFSPDLPPPRA